MAEEPEINPGDEIEDEEQADDTAGIYDVCQDHTERLRAYTAFLRNTVPHIGTTVPFDCGKEPEVDPDVASARNLAVMAVYADIRRIAGDGRPVHDAEASV